MSFITPSDALGLAAGGSSGLPPISAADLPASVRNGPPAAKQAYTEALEFEQVLVNQLAQQLTATMTQNRATAPRATHPAARTLARTPPGPAPVTSAPGYWAPIRPQVCTQA